MDLPLTYVEARARFRRACATRGFATVALPIAARGPDDERLTLDVVTLGPPDPARVLVVLSGVHGVEGFIGSALQAAWLAALEPQALPPDMGVVVVHAVNPWGMAWWRRQNEHNVDLNRNWRRSATDPCHNDAYDEVHHLACPDTDTLASVDDLVVSALALVAERGLPWVRDAITVGQYRHADGLHYGGAETEESNRLLEALVRSHLSSAERVLTIDLHTGHGPMGAVTFLSDQPPGSAQDAFFRAHFPGVRIEATVDNPDATTATKSGQIANGLREMLPTARCFSTSVELGTASDEEQLAATYQEQWVHRRGDRTNPEHAAAIWRYRSCFTPEDPAWARQALDAGGRVLDDALRAVTQWA